MLLEYTSISGYECVSVYPAFSSRVFCRSASFSSSSVVKGDTRIVMFVWDVVAMLYTSLEILLAKLD